MPARFALRSTLLVALAGALSAACGAEPGGTGGNGGPSESADDAGATAPTQPGTPAADAGTVPPKTDGGASGADAGTHHDAGASADAGEATDAGASSGPTIGQQIASIALANVGKGACSTNSAGGTAYETSCTGNGGQPEYWCADFAQWVWAQAGADTTGLDAAAGSFYTYGSNRGTLHDAPLLGDAVVFNYTGGGVAEHVALVVKVDADGTIETVSGDWDGTGSTEAAFSSTSHAVLNTPAYAGTVGSTPSVMGQTISGFISPATSGSGAGCYSDTLGKEMPANACVQSNSDNDWYECDDGVWVDRSSDPTPCNGTYPL